MTYVGTQLEQFTLRVSELELFHSEKLNKNSSKAAHAEAIPQGIKSMGAFLKAEINNFSARGADDFIEARALLTGDHRIVDSVNQE